MSNSVLKDLSNELEHLNTGKSCARIPDDTRALVKAMASAGWSYSKIQAVITISKGSVSNIVNEDSPLTLKDATKLHESLKEGRIETNRLLGMASDAVLLQYLEDVMDKKVKMHNPIPVVAIKDKSFVQERTLLDKPSSIASIVLSPEERESLKAMALEAATKAIDAVKNRDSIETTSTEHVEDAVIE